MTATIKPEENVRFRLFSLLNLSDFDITFWKQVSEVHRREPWLHCEDPVSMRNDWTWDSSVCCLSWCYQCRRFLPFRSVSRLDGKLLL